MIDWSKPETLRFRDFDAKILEVLVPKNEKALSRKYPVLVFYEDKDGKIWTDFFTIDGVLCITDSLYGHKDIIQIKKVPLSFDEIALMVIENGGLNVFSKGTDFDCRIWGINTETQEFLVRSEGVKFVYSADRVCECFEYTLDGVERLTFEKDEE